MLISDILHKKRNSQKLTFEEIKYVISSYTAGKIPDYQMSAFLMAAFINGFTSVETGFLTKAMLESGETMDLSGIEGVKIDKHSTGGVGDGTSLVIAPLAASCGVIVPMMSGRSLGHTGGTLDKLESIPGFRVNLSKEEFIHQLKKIGVAMAGQTDKIAPADKKMYALRDVTATVDSIPLIASSIMSKKLAEGCDGLVLDVKTGSGAFMKEKTMAKRLAKEMIGISKSFGKKAIALITDMNQPLGYAVGNSLEVKQAIDIMKGEGPKDLVNLIIEISSRMLFIAGEKNTKKSKTLLENNLKNGKALMKFKEIIEYQSGDTGAVDNPEKILPKAQKTLEILSVEEGFVEYADTKLVGDAANLLGAGRLTKEDTINHGAGIVLKKKQGERISRKEPLATFCFDNGASIEEAKLKFTESIKITKTTPKKLSLIYEKLETL
ncbi:MAG: thymidine phosphorylase [Elusimicrobia bacterium]|nr:thymidine phosphorylase [Elusimicrobiota bacterium]